MTACVNKRRALAAALAGVLALGGGLALAAPTVALAAGASVQFASDDEVTDGTATPAFKTATGTVTPTTNADGVPEISVGSCPVWVDADGMVLTLAGQSSSGKKIVINSGTVKDYKVRVYGVDAKTGEKTTGSLSGNKVSEVGTYLVEVRAVDGDYEGQTFSYTFNVKAKSFGTLTVTAAAGDVLVYTGSAKRLVVKDNGTALTSEDYSVVYKKADGTVVDSVVDAGTYTAVVSGAGDYAGASGTVTFTVYPFKLGSYTSITVDDFVGEAPSHPSSVKNSSQGASLDPSLIGIVPINPNPVSTASTTAIQWTATPNAAAVAAGNIVKDYSGDYGLVGGHKLDKMVSFYYNGSALASSYELYNAKGDTFNLGGITAKYGSTDVAVTAKSVALKASAGVTYTPSGSDYSNDLQKGTPGEYTVTVSVSVATDGTTVYGGSSTFTVKVWKDSLDADAQVWVYGPYYGMTAITEYAAGYDQSVLYASSFDVVAKDAKGNAVAAGDLKSHLVDADGKTVLSIKDAGSYKLVVESDWYKLTGTTELPITIGKVALSTAKVGVEELWNDVAGEAYVPLNTAGTYSYTVQHVRGDVDEDDVFDSGEKWSYYKADGTIAQAISYTSWSIDHAPESGWVKDTYTKTYTYGGMDVSDNLDAIWTLLLSWQTGVDGDATDDPQSTDFYGYNYENWDILPDCVDVVVEQLQADGETWKEVTEITEAGKYRATLTVSDDIKDNFDSTEKVLEFTVAVNSGFSDVEPSDWYSAFVSKAASLGYMNGYAGTSTFGPTDSLTRGQACIVLMNMSGWTTNNETDNDFSETYGWKTGFADVDGKAYYAQAIYWAAKSGIVTGYKDGSGNFGPDDKVTREQFATMLARYAQVVNRDESVAKADGTSLAKMSDASSVDSWAASSVDWCVSKGLMGANGTVNPTDNVERAQVAKMVSTYQPTKKAAK